ncbi:MAG: phosphate/phosphite/phosphonate ABC transporter substrate-binding protein [Acidobacteriota bacterium]
MPRPGRFLALAVLLAAATATAASPRPKPLRLGVVNFYNPRLMYIKYQPLVDYLSRQTGQVWELALATSYQSTVDELCAGRLDVAYLGPFTYARAHEQCGAVPVVQLRSRGSTAFRSSILVRNDSAVRSIADLRGRSIGFGAPLSTSSHLVPREMLERAGLRPGVDFTCRYYDHHERAARAVLLGDVEACAVRDLVGERFVQRGLRVLAQSEPMPNFPLVLAPGQRAKVRDDLVRVLVDVPAADAKVRAAIAAWDVELAGGFAVCQDAQFDGVRSLAAGLFGPAALRLPESALTCASGEP